MAILKSAAFKVAQKTVINTVVNNRNISNLSSKKSAALSRLNPSNPMTKLIHSILEDIKRTAVKGEYIYVKTGLSDLFLKRFGKYINKKKYGGLKFKQKNGLYTIILYWGPDKALRKLIESDEDIKLLKSPNDAGFENYDCTDIRFQRLPIKEWVEFFNGKKAMIKDPRNNNKYLNEDNLGSVYQILK